MKTSKIRIYIARKDDSLDWLLERPKAEKGYQRYLEFLSNTDTIIVGRRTYEEDVKLGADWASPGRCKIYLVTTNENYTPQTDNTEIIRQIDQKTIDRIRAGSQKNIWVVGGGQIISELLSLGVIDEMNLYIVPTIIGSGIRLFPNEPKETKFDVVRVEHFETGMVSLIYQPQK